MAAACLISFFRFGREAEHSNFEKYCQKLKRSLAIVLHSCAFWGRWGGGTSVSVPGILILEDKKAQNLQHYKLRSLGPLCP